MTTNNEALAAISSPRRREILRLIWDKELNAGRIHKAMADVTFGAVSLQLRALSEAGVVTSRSEGRHRYYQADREALAPVSDLLEKMWGDSLSRLKLAAELEQSRRGPLPQRRAARPSPTPSTRGKAVKNRKR